MKYEILRNDHITFAHPFTELPIRVFRIIYIRDIWWKSEVGTNDQFIAAGTLGGFIQSEENLSQEDSSILMNNAIVFDKAILRNSYARDYSKIFGESIIESCEIFGSPRIFGKTKAIHCIFRDRCNVGGMLELEKSFFANSTHVSGICKVKGCDMRIGSIIRGQCTVIDTDMTDVSEICGISTIRNCQLSGRAFAKNANLTNQTLYDHVNLNVVSKEGDLFPH